MPNQERQTRVFAICQNPDGDGVWWELEDGESAEHCVMSTPGFDDCCTPRRFVALEELQAAQERVGELEAKFEKTDARYVQARAEMLEASIRAEEVERERDGLQKRFDEVGALVEQFVASLPPADRRKVEAAAASTQQLPKEQSRDIGGER